MLSPVVSSRSLYRSASCTVLWKGGEHVVLLRQQWQKVVVCFVQRQVNIYPCVVSRCGAVKCVSAKRTGELQNASSFGVMGSNELQKQLQEFFDQVKSMVLLGDKEGATDLLFANYSVLKEQLDAGFKGMEQAAFLDVVAFGFMAVGDTKSVERLLQLLHEIVDCLQNDEPFLDSLLMHMGSMYMTLGRLEDAMIVYERGLQILEGLFGKFSPFLIAPLMGMAKVFELIGRAKKAVEAYNRAIGILEIRRGTKSKGLVVPLFGLGNLFIKEGRAADAEISFKRILNIYKESYGDKNGRVGMAMCSLAHAMCAKGNTNDAILLYRKGLQVIKDSNFMSLDDDVLVKMRIDLAELLHVAGREHEGRQLLEECLLISERYLGKEHPSSVVHLINLARSYSRSKNFVEAERLLRTSLQIMLKAVTPDDQSLTSPMLHLTVVLYHLKRYDEAEKLALEVVRIRENAFGKESFPVGEALDCLISIQARIGKDDNDLLILLNRVLSIQEQVLGYESEEVMLTLRKIILLLDKMGRNREKLPLQRRLTVLRRKHKQKIPV